MQSDSQTRRQIVAGGLAALAAPLLPGCKPSGQKRQAIAKVLRPRQQHWVGDGFRVSTVFSPHIIDAQLLSPFVLLDHARPRHFEPATQPRGVGEHPHRGFETVTFAYQGEVEHRDSHGGGGTVSAGDVQWMTAASGVVHEEFQSRAFTKTGGIFEMVQLWVNLPAKDKMGSPAYQRLPAESFPSFELGDATARLVAGELHGKRGPAVTHSPMTVFDIEFAKVGEVSFQLAEQTTTLLLMLRGNATVQGAQSIGIGELVVFDRASSGAVTLSADADTQVLVLNGQPLEEPVVAHGPFVMNTKEEIVQAIHDFQAGKMGRLAPKESKESKESNEGKEAPWES